MITISCKRFVAFFATLACLVGMVTFIPKFGESAEAKLSTADAYLTPEEVGKPIIITDPSNRVTFTIQQITDGIDSNKCIITEENGFDLVDTGSQDGVVCVNDVIRYRISYNVAASDTATNLKLNLNSIVENRDGVKISQRDTFTRAGILQFASGGQGFLHTGTVEGSNSNPVLSMTFPPSQETSSVEGTILELQTVSGHIDQVINLEAKITSPTETAIKKFENPIIVVGTTLWDPKLYNSTPTPSFVVENGQSFYEYEISLYIPANSRESSNKNLIGYADNAYVTQDARIVMDTSSFPENSIVEAISSDVTISGSEVIYENNAIQYNGAIRSSSSKGEKIFRVKVPASELENNQSYEWNAHITEYESRAYNTLDSNSSPLLKPYGFMGQGNNIEPGLGENSDYNTSSSYKNVELTKVGTDYPNNDWAKATVTTNNTGEGQRYKDMWADDGGSVSTNNVNRLVNTSSKIFIGDKYWAELGSKPYNGTLTNVAYCDAWNERYQRIDSTRNIISQVRDEDNGWSNVPHTVMYGDASNSYIDNSSESYTGATISNKCDNVNTVWTTEPNANTNLVKIVLNGSYSAAVSGTENVQRVYVPMETTEEENYANGTTYYVSDRSVYNNFVLNNNETRWDDAAPRAGVAVRYETLNPVAATLANSTQNAGTTLPITNIGKVSSANRMKDFEDFETIPVVEYKFDSAYSNITLADSIYEKYNVTVTRPDHGPDGLAGTNDDAPDSYWVFRLEAKEPVLMTNSNSSVDLVNLGNNAFTGTLPGYIPAGTELVKKLDYFPDENIQQYKDIETDNHKEGKITVFASAAVFQGKWALEDVDYAGNEVSWGINYGSTMGNNTYNGLFYDILPYDGDSRGTILEEPLSNIEFDIRQGDNDMTIEVTDADPSTITRQGINNGSIKFVPLEDAETLVGEITAFVIREAVIQPSSLRHIEVTASTAGSVADNVVINNLEAGSVEGYSNAIPQTPIVSTRLVSGTISGTVYFDDNQNGAIDNEENKRYEGTVISLLDEQGNTVTTTTTNNNGNYSFEKVSEGNYTVVVGERGENLGNSLVETGETEYAVSITTATPTHNALNFGYWSASQPSITVEKRIDGYADGASIADGTSVTFEAVVTNTGNMPLDGIVVNDDVLGNFVCPQDSLDASESMICSLTADYKTTQ